MTSHDAPACRVHATPGVAEDALELGYRRAPMLADLARAGAGLVLAVLPLVFLRPAWPVALGLVGLAALFAVFLAQTWRRRRTTVRVDGRGILVADAAGAHPQRLAWRDLERLRLRWFGPRRANGGWLDLELLGVGGERVTVSSALEGFDRVLEQALGAAERNGVALEPVTRANVEAALGGGGAPSGGRTAPRPRPRRG